MRSLLFALASASLFTAAPAFAEATEAEVLELFEVMNMEEAHQATMAEWVEQMIKAEPQLQQFSDILTEQMADVMGFEAFKTVFVEIYANSFTSKEIKQLKKLYKSPVGKSIMQKMPDVASQVGLMSQLVVADRRTEFQTNFRAAMMERVKEMKEGEEGPVETKVVEEGPVAAEPGPSATGETTSPAQGSTPDETSESSSSAGE